MLCCSLGGQRTGPAWARRPAALSSPCSLRRALSPPERAGAAGPGLESRVPEAAQTREVCGRRRAGRRAQAPDGTALVSSSWRRGIGARLLAWAAVGWRGLDLPVPFLGGYSSAGSGHSLVSPSSVPAPSGCSPHPRCNRAPCVCSVECLSQRSTRLAGRKTFYFYL